MREVHKLRRQNPRTGLKRSYRAIAALLAEQNHLNVNGRPYAAASIATSPTNRPNRPAPIDFDETIDDDYVRNYGFKTASCLLTHCFGRDTECPKRHPFANNQASPGARDPEDRYTGTPSHSIRFRESIIWPQRDLIRAKLPRKEAKERLMKYTVAMVILFVLGAAVIGDGYVKSVRAEQYTLKVRATVSALTLQQLATTVWECDAQRGAPRAHGPIYCSEASSRLDSLPLEAVQMRPTNYDPVLPRQYLPAGSIKKVTVVAPPTPSIPSGPVIFPATKT